MYGGEIPAEQKLIKRATLRDAWGNSKAQMLGEEKALEGKTANPHSPSEAIAVSFLSILFPDGLGNLEPSAAENEPPIARPMLLGEFAKRYGFRLNTRCATVNVPRRQYTPLEWMCSDTVLATV